MANTTINYGLKKPLGNENFNIEDFNGNTDIIDTKLNEQANKLTILTGTGVAKEKANKEDLVTTNTNVTNLTNSVATSLADLSTQATNNLTDKDIIRLAKTSTGTVNTLSIDTTGTFDLTKDGNMLMLLPNLTNTGATTISVDGQTTKNIKKFNVDTDAYVDLVAGDLKKNTPTQIVWSVGSSFFILRPSGSGSNIKSIQRGNLAVNTTTKNVTISSIDLTKSIVYVSIVPDGYGQSNLDMVMAEITTSTNLQLKIGDSTFPPTVYWTIVEFNNVKTLQKGSVTFSTSTKDVAITPIDVNKSIVVASFIINNTGAGIWQMLSAENLTSNINLRLYKYNNTESRTVAWQVMEFN